MTDPDINNKTSHLRGIALARAGGRVFGAVLALGGLLALLRGAAGFDSFRAVYGILYGAILILPLSRLGSAAWKGAFTGLCFFSAGHVFVLVVAVMYQYMEMAEIGERLGVPGLEGSLVFLSLLQPPIALFQRHPDLFD
ncbi:MAG: hypothetical protein ACPGGJ_00455 [Coraliomargarita sp.]